MKLVLAVMLSVLLAVQSLSASAAPTKHKKKKLKPAGFWVNCLHMKAKDLKPGPILMRHDEKGNLLCRVER